MKLQGVLIDAYARIVPVSLVVCAAAAALGYWHTRAVVMASDVRMLTLAAQRALPALPVHEQKEQLDLAVRNMVRDGFAVAQAYAPAGEKVAEAVQPGFESLPEALAALSHVMPASAGASDNPVVLGQKTVRVFTPVSSAGGAVIGHLEGIRIVSAEERLRYREAAIESALIVALSVLLCTIVLSPLLTKLARKNFNWACSLLEANLGMLEAFGRAIAKRDSDTGLHNYRVSWIAARIGEEAGLTSAQLRDLVAGAFLHDIGKIGIPDAILLKPGALDDRERAMMQTHVEIGAYIVGSVGFLGARDVIEGHHEKWDGSGYPNQLAGESIPLNARVFCIADVFDALRAKRPYKEAYSAAQSMEIMRAGKGKHFDPVLLDVFERIVAEAESTVINANEEQVIASMRRMTEKHFFAASGSGDGEGWPGHECSDSDHLPRDAGGSPKHGESMPAAGGKLR